MSRRIAILPVMMLGLGMLCGTATADQVYLYADFNDKTIDASIGTGGAQVGEPIHVGPQITAIVRDGPMGSPSLEITDASETASGVAAFALLDDAEISSGIINISVDLWFHTLAPSYRFVMDVREAGGAMEMFTTLYFLDGGGVNLWDENDYVGRIGTYEVGRRVRLILEYDMDAGTYDIWLDGTLVVDDRAHGIVGRGIGTVSFGSDYDEDLEGHFNIDVVSVTDYFQAVATEEHTWGRVKAGYR